MPALWKSGAAEARAVIAIKTKPMSDHIRAALLREGRSLLANALMEKTSRESAIYTRKICQSSVTYV